MRKAKQILFLMIILCNFVFLNACGSSVPANSSSNSEHKTNEKISDSANGVTNNSNSQKTNDDETNMNQKDDAGLDVVGFDITSDMGNYFDRGFSEGLAWTQYYDEDNGYGLGIINEEGNLVFGAYQNEWEDNLDHSPIYHNTLFQDDVSCVYSNDSYIIFDKEGNILTHTQSTDAVKYHMLGYGYGEFLVWKEVEDIERKTSDFVYLIDADGNVVSEVLIDGGSVSNHQFTCLSKGVFTDGLYFCDMYQERWIELDSNMVFDLEHWADQKGCTCMSCWIFDNYPMARVYAYYDENRGFILNDSVYQIRVLDEIYNEWHYVFYDIDGNVIGDIYPDVISGLKIKEIGLYSNGFIPIQLEDAKDNTYVSVIDIDGNPLFKPVDVDFLDLNPASYNGYFSVRAYKNDDDVKVITPTGEVKRIGDDLSGLGSDASLHMRSGCGSFISGGFWFDMNRDGELLYSSAGELKDNMYVSIDGKKTIDKVKLTSDTKGFPTLSSKKTSQNEMSLDLFQGSPSEYNADLAKIAAILSERCENESPEDIEKIYQLYNINDVKSYNYGNLLFGGGACTIGTYSEADAKVLVITCRGSKTVAEFIGDWKKGWFGDETRNFLGKQVYKNDCDFYVKILDALEDYKATYPELQTEKNLKVFINGHSLGGAAASMFGAKVDSDISSGIFFNKNVKKEDVFVYTFGAIKVLATNDNVTSGYENIHNIYNYYDTFGPNGNHAWTKASLPEAKFGHTDLFYLDRENLMISSENHGMATYRAALEIDEIKKGFIDKKCK